MSREFGSFAAWTTGTPDASNAPPPEVHYRAEVELGRGGMGVVLPVRDTWLGRRVDASVDDTSTRVIARSGEVYRVDDALRRLFHHPGTDHIRPLQPLAS